VADTRWFVGELVDVILSDEEDDSQPASTEAAALTPSPPADDQQAPVWPLTEVGPATECFYQYPDDLADRL